MAIPAPLAASLPKHVDAVGRYPLNLDFALSRMNPIGH